MLTAHSLVLYQKKMSGKKMRHMSYTVKFKICPVKYILRRRTFQMQVGNLMLTERGHESGSLSLTPANLKYYALSSF